MKAERIPYEQTGRFTKIVTDYLQEVTALQPFYKYKPGLDSFQTAIINKSAEQIDRNLLSDTILKQYGDIGIIPFVKENIELFRDQNTFCIVTAHQLNIFTGPLYVIYKTISAIQLCKSLREKYPSNNFVPVFWLGSEDHDFEEINHFELFGKTYTWEDKQGGACGKYDTKGLAAIIAELETVLGDVENAQSLITLFSKAYLYSENLSRATRVILNELFGIYGLVIVDGDDTYFKSLCKNIIEDEIFNRTAEKLVNKTLEIFPFDAQATPREINLFYLKEYTRERIIFDAAKNIYSVLNTDITFTSTEISQEIKLHPENFSPNVILRPLFQQKVLPSLAYIGGGGELAYWLQLKSLFEFHNIDFPVLLLRDSFLIIDNNTNKKVQKLHLNSSDLFKDENILINDFVRANSTESVSLKNEIDEIEIILTRILVTAKNIDNSLEKTVLGEKQNMINGIQKLESRLLKAEKMKMDAEVNQIRAILAKLFPNNGLQERKDNLISYYLKYGPGFFDQLLSAASQPNPEFIILTFDEV